MYTKITALITVAVSLSGVATANTPLLVNTNFDGYTGWIAGANKFAPVDTWREFVSAPEAFPWEERVAPSGAGFVYSSWDDGASDKLENYLFQEFRAGPTDSIFETGDEIVFRGSASATRTGADTSDMVVRAFIKVLGYNELGWENQTKEQYSAFHIIGETLEPFDMMITFPDLAVDDSLQVVQLGFEITTLFDSSSNSMDAGTIYFENLEGYVVGEEEPVVMWAGFVVDASGIANTGDWLGMVYTEHAPWIYVYDMGKYMFMPTEAIATSGAWSFVPGN
jgi:hypothetical protein